MPTREDMDEIDLFGTKVPNKSATVKMEAYSSLKLPYDITVMYIIYISSCHACSEISFILRVNSIFPSRDFVK